MKIEVRNLGYTYPGNGQPVLKGIDFTLHQGEVLSILGPNGSGKTTLLNCLMNLFTATTGGIYLDGKPVSAFSKKEIAKKIGYVPQFHEAAHAYSVLEFVAMGRTPYIGVFSTPSKADKALARDAITAMQIDHLAHKDYTHLSGGERQQVILARTVTQNPEVIILDEPTNHLDYGNQIRALQMLKKLSMRGYTIIMTTHNPDHALMMEDKAAIINGHHTFTFGPSRKVLNEAALKRLYRVDLEMLHLHDKNRTICIPPALDRVINPSPGSGPASFPKRVRRSDDRSKHGPS